VLEYYGHPWYGGHMDDDDNDDNNDKETGTA
jgi:hypothetical protein